MGVPMGLRNLGEMREGVHGVLGVFKRGDLGMEGDTSDEGGLVLAGVCEGLGDLCPEGVTAWEWEVEI